MSGMNLLAIGLALVASNYGYQALMSADWAAAFERSFFQAGALLVVYFNRVLKIRLERLRSNHN